MGMFFGAAATDSPGESGYVIGGALGLLGAVALDAAVLSYDKVDSDGDGNTRDAGVPSLERPRVAHRASPRPVPKLAALMPAFAPRSEGGFDVRIGGAF
jgi:hypothetical protein